MSCIELYLYLGHPGTYPELSQKNHPLAPGTYPELSQKKSSLSTGHVPGIESKKNSSIDLICTDNEKIL